MFYLKSAASFWDVTLYSYNLEEVFVVSVERIASCFKVEA
jgi:hypothetical protein